MEKILFTCLSAAAIALTGCGQAAQQASSEPIESRTGFALALFRNTVASQDKDANVLVSPFSAGTALSMLAEGAEGQTREELVSAMGGQLFPSDLLAVDTIADVRSANSAWLRSGFHVKDTYSSLLEQTYGAMIAEKDFSSPQTVDAINSWCSENTEGRITEIVDQISPDMMLFLVNALYFKAPWQNEFNPAVTADRTFHGSAGDKQVPMMTMTKHLSYAEADGSQLVELPYKGGRYSMLVMLPQSGLSIDDVVAGLSEQNFRTALDMLGRRKVHLTLPRFKFDTDLVLNSILMEMGVKKVFSTSAELDGISDARICVDQVRQKCFIEVNEEGSEAAAVTSIGLKLTSAPTFEPIVEMNVDRPFLFAIADRTSDNILFIGRVMNI